jgi:hypothetical protein
VQEARAFLDEREREDDGAAHSASRRTQWHVACTGGRPMHTSLEGQTQSWSENAALRGAGLATLARLASALPVRWATELAIPQTGYARRVVFRDEHIEVIACAWAPGHVGTWHGHGASLGIVRVVQGTLVEARFVHDGEVLRPERVVLRAPRMSALPEHSFHRVTGVQSLRSLHVYSPPLPEVAPPLPEALVAEALTLEGAPDVD